MEKAKKSVIDEPISVNVTQATPPVTADTSQTTHDPAAQAAYGTMTGYGDSRRGFRGGRGSHRGRGGRFGGTHKFSVRFAIR